MVFVSYGPKSQQNLRKLSLMIERLREYYEISLVHVPDDVIDGLPYVRIEPFDASGAPPKELSLVCDLESKI